MDAETAHLLSFLQDEFRNEPDVRVRIRHRAVTRRSVDLEQDYDPESNSLHLDRGVMVKARSREYFFRAEWATGRERSKVDSLVQEIRDFLGRSHS